jgi:SAM-dependent methyltransferase
VSDDDAMAAKAAIAAQVGEFYERHPYPPAIDDLDAYRRRWDDTRRRAESHLFWPADLYRDERAVLVAGCGTSQAAHYAVRWPQARVVGIDVSATSIAFEEKLKRDHQLHNLELHRLRVEQARELGRNFDHVVCTGVLHHLADPDAGLRALRDVLEPSGAIHLMVYARYGRAGVYLLQEYCRRLGIEATAGEIGDLVAAMQSLPPDHPIATLLQKSPDFASEAGVADALLHPRDRPYSVPQLMEFLDGAGLVFGRWLRQAPYLPFCGAIASTPHRDLLARLSEREQYAAVELFRGTMVRHSVVAYASQEAAHRHHVNFAGDAWLGSIPIRLPDAVIVRERLPAGAAAVLINRNHTFTDLCLPIDERQERLLECVDGKRRVADMGRATADKNFARDFFAQLWRWDQVVFDTSG